MRHKAAMVGGGQGQNVRLSGSINNTQKHHSTWEGNSKNGIH